MKNYTIFRTKQFNKDLKEITRYIAKNNPHAALNFFQNLLCRIDTVLSVFPETFRRYKNCYMWPYKNYLLFYEIDKVERVVKLFMMSHASQYEKYKNRLS